MNPNLEDTRRDHLIGDVLDGLTEYFSALKSVGYRWKCAAHLATVYRDTSNNQLDYDFLRDAAEVWLNSKIFRFAEAT
jgi:hypothetical protein